MYIVFTAVLRIRLLYKSTKACATIPKGFVGNGCLPLFDRSSLHFSQKEGESMNLRTHALLLHRVKATRTLIKQW